MPTLSTWQVYMIRLFSTLILILGMCCSVYVFVDHSDVKTQPDKKLSVNSFSGREENNKFVPMQSERIPTSLAEFRLAGIITDDKHSIRAIIAQHGEQATYKINDSLPVTGKVILTNILPDRVIINNNGQVESLQLHDQPMSSIAPTSEVTKEVPIFYGRTLGPDEPQPYQPNIEGEERSLEKISHYFSNLMKLSILRNENTNQLLGYRISREGDVEKFNTAGLRDGDMITAINGIPLTKADDILANYKNNMDGKMSLEIEREGSVELVEITP